MKIATSLMLGIYNEIMNYLIDNTNGFINKMLNV